MNKIKITTIGERVEINLNFDSLSAAKFFFSQKDCIEDLIGVLTGENDEVEKLKEETDETFSSIADDLKTVDNTVLERMNRLLQDELNRRK